MRAITQDELTATLPSVLAAARTDRFLVEDANGEPIAAVVSPADYEVLRRAGAEAAVRALQQFGRKLSSVATPEQIEQLERELDRKAYCRS